MSVKTYNKLVRDRIPEIIEVEGNTCVTEILSDADYLKMVDAKLDEELAEYHQDQNLEELADLTEVIHAAVIARGYTLEDLERVRAEKAAQRGSFKKKILLKEVTKGHPHTIRKRQPQWSIEEAVALMDLSLREHRNVSKEKIRLFSNACRKRGESNGILVDEKYRNETGIQMQLYCIDYILTDGKEGLSNASRIFYKAHELYKTDPTRFQKIARNFWDTVGSSQL